MIIVVERPVSVAVLSKPQVIGDNFETEEDAYVWLRFKYGYNSIPDGEEAWFEGFVIEPETVP